MTRLVMWDIDRTLLVSGKAAHQAYATAFTAVTGVAWRAMAVTAGRTDRDISAEIFAAHGIADCEPHLDGFFTRYADEVHAARHLIAEQGHLLPGVRDVLQALAGRPGVVQTVVTGNIPAVAAAKVGAFDLARAFDMDIGGYGADDVARAPLVRRCLERTHAKYGGPVHPVVIGDTTFDVAAALACGAVAVGVATGATSAAELARAGAHAVLDDLSDVDAAVAVIAG
ncbi:HAD family hydrolase [Krasilnikovia sp. MM14-A1004]|uniref:HAD family hydrolase n=1 Tax=Krasilnikovia sp. MM14-A1004 TaxID=3373541 RepID=UPI00399CD870